MSCLVKEENGFDIGHSPTTYFVSGTVADSDFPKGVATSKVLA